MCQPYMYKLWVYKLKKTIWWKKKEKVVKKTITWGNRSLISDPQLNKFMIQFSILYFFKKKNSASHRKKIWQDLGSWSFKDRGRVWLLARTNASTIWTAQLTKGGLHKTLENHSSFLCTVGVSLLLLPSVPTTATDDIPNLILHLSHNIAT